MLFHQAALSLFHLLGIEELDLVFAFTSCGDGGRHRAPVKLLGAEPGVEHGDPDAGVGPQLQPMQRQTLINNSEHLLT